jgi:hypothetical protein
MILAIPIEDFNKQYVLYLKPTKNKLMENATFTKIIYSPPTIMLNGIYLYIKHIPVDSIVDIERNVLSSYTSDKTPTYSIQKSLQKHSNVHVLKISGIWENEKAYGLAYKVIHENHLF